MNQIDSDTTESVARVFKAILDQEADSDHVQTIEDALERLWAINGSVIDVNPSNVTEDDVEATFEFFEAYAPSDDEMMDHRANNNGERHPNRDFNYIFDFVDREARYVNGCLPSFRDWNVEYIRNGSVVETRTYDHDDEIPTDPEINGVRHECEYTERGDGDVTVYVSQDPIRSDVDVVINAEGDDFINLEGHNGPNVPNEEKPISVLENNFDWGMLGDTQIIIKDDPGDVIEFIEDQGWSFDRI